MSPDRIQCEVRHVLRLRAVGQQRMLDYLALVEGRRGKESADKLREQAAAQWFKHNRGAWGDWR